MPNTTDMHQLIEHRRRANTARGELLQLISDGILTPWEGLVAAATAGEKALLRLTLDQLVTAGPGIGQARARDITAQVAHILATTEAHTTTGRVTIGYILDERARGRRLLAVLDAFISHGLIRQNADLPVWTGFPFTPRPVDAKVQEQR
ncbi:hypothetical protein BH708_02305 [Brachybacterium sp. P6-10-X1]|uniref:hypothetical protein n=1 Tax=Brachybacterium sp. P6-10-X1 TaxID=1903186 RepID=UPI000971B41B|nr:hypothetical protein [Brachybacterium sp. P6-10-X1]APX31740.1 hypothetical protein BH708_02305 [Brachybacterium sp. P6-10-X1]